MIFFSLSNLGGSAVKLIKSSASNPFGNMKNTVNHMKKGNIRSAIKSGGRVVLAPFAAVALGAAAVATLPANLIRLHY